MDFADALTATKYQGRPCKVGNWLAEHPQADQIQEALEGQDGGAYKYDTAWITRAMQQLGFAGGAATVKRHRDRDCRCYD